MGKEDIQSSVSKTVSVSAYCRDSVSRLKALMYIGLRGIVSNVSGFWAVALK